MVLKRGCKELGASGATCRDGQEASQGFHAQLRLHGGSCWLLFGPQGLFRNSLSPMWPSPACGPGDGDARRVGRGDPEDRSLASPPDKRANRSTADRVARPIQMPNCKEFVPFER